MSLEKKMFKAKLPAVPAQRETDPEGHQPEFKVPAHPYQLPKIQEDGDPNLPLPTPASMNLCNPYVRCTTEVYELPQSSGTEEPLTFVCLHGAGQTALSFGLLAQALHQSMKGACCVIAFDARGHGTGEHSLALILGESSRNHSDLSIDQLVSDLNGVVRAAVPHGAVILVGHSMGGAVVAKAALAAAVGGRLLAGMVVIDVVEGTALAALAGMDRVLEARPKTFPSPEAAIAWAIQSGTLRNAASARISMPSQLVPAEGCWEWRTDLASTRPFWVGWFTGLSDHFLGAKTPKLLLLAGTDRLDKTLMVAHMQGKAPPTQLTPGKFQLEVRPATSHTIQEDDPIGVAHILAGFAKRHHCSLPF